MPSKFGKTSSGFSNKGEREKFLFIAAAGTALAVVVVFILVAGFRSGAPTAPPPEAALDPVAAVSLDRDSVSVITLDAEVAPGTALSQAQFKKKSWPRATAPEDAFRDPSEVAGLYAKVKLLPHLPLQRKDTTNSEDDQSGSSIVPTRGMRAVTINVDDTSGLEGFALAGTRVDVVLTHSKDGNLMSTIIVQNARVLSYGGDRTGGAQSVRERRPVRVAQTLTLEVSTEDALKIQTARQMGRLSLLLRNQQDDQAPRDLTATGSDIVKPEKPTRTVMQPSAEKRQRIRMGGKDYLIGPDGLVPAE